MIKTLVAALIVAASAMGGVATAQTTRAAGEPNFKANELPGSFTERLQRVAPGRADLDCVNTRQTQPRLASADFCVNATVDACAGDKFKLVGLADQAKVPAKLALLTHAAAHPNARCSA